MAHIGLKCKQTKNKNMKQLLPIFLFLVPCFALAQYPSNGNQKITLGEQTTADGLIFRGVAVTDTVRKPSIDTMAYMVLDTTTNIMWHYKKATSNAWLRLNLLPSDTASMLTNYWRAGRFSGVLPVANGGTGASVRTFVDTINTQTVNGAKTFSSTITGARFDPTSSSADGNGMYLAGPNKLGFSTNGIERFVQTNSSLSINRSNPLGYPLEIFGTTVNTRLYVAGTTNPVVAQFANNGGTWYFGMDDDTGSFYSTGIAYARFINSSLDVPFIFFTNSTERLKIHGSGGLKFKPQSAPTAEEGTVYYDSATKKLKVYNGTSWIDLH
jgi:hypothetical protein